MTRVVVFLGAPLLRRRDGASGWTAMSSPHSASKQWREIAVPTYREAPTYRDDKKRPHNQASESDGDDDDDTEDEVVNMVEATQRSVNALERAAATTATTVASDEADVDWENVLNNQQLRNFVHLKDLVDGADVPFAAVVLVRAMQPSTVKISKGALAGDIATVQNFVVCDHTAYFTLTCWRHHAQRLAALPPGCIILVKGGYVRSFRSTMSLATRQTTELVLCQRWNTVDNKFDPPLLGPLRDVLSAGSLQARKRPASEKQEQLHKAEVYVNALAQWSTRHVPHLLRPIDGGADSLVEVDDDKERFMLGERHKARIDFSALNRDVGWCSGILSGTFSGTTRVFARIRRVWFVGCRDAQLDSMRQARESLLCVVCLRCEGISTADANGIHPLCPKCHSQGDLHKTLRPACMAVTDDDQTATAPEFHVDLTRNALGEFLDLFSNSRYRDWAKPLSEQDWNDLWVAWGACAMKPVELTVQVSTDVDEHGRVRWRSVPIVTHVHCIPV